MLQLAAVAAIAELMLNSKNDLFIGYRKILRFALHFFFSLLLSFFSYQKCSLLSTLCRPERYEYKKGDDGVQHGKCNSAFSQKPPQTPFNPPGSVCSVFGSLTLFSFLYRPGILRVCNLKYSFMLGLCVKSSKLRIKLSLKKCP